MNYERIYSEFIADRLTKQPVKPDYFEKHHILPRSLGGGEDTENIVCLTMEDHIRAHILLAKIHGGRLWSALFLMTKKTVGRTKLLRRIPSKYEIRAAVFAKKMFALHWRTEDHPMHGKRHKDDSRVKMSNTHKERGRLGLIWTQKSKDLISGDKHWTKQEKNSDALALTIPKFKKNLEKAVLANMGSANVMHRPEVKAKLRASQKLHWANGTGGASKEARRKNADSHATDEYREAARQRCLGEKNHNFGLSGGKSYNSRKVLCVETGVIFNSVKEAVLFCGGDVTKAARTGGRAGLYTWKRLDTHACDNRVLKIEKAKSISQGIAQY